MICHINGKTHAWKTTQNMHLSDLDDDTLALIVLSVPMMRACNRRFHGIISDKNIQERVENMANVKSHVLYNLLSNPGDSFVFSRNAELPIDVLKNSARQQAYSKKRQDFGDIEAILKFFELSLSRDGKKVIGLKDLNSKPISPRCLFD